MKNKSAITILVADDDLEDCQMIREAFEESLLKNPIQFVHNGEELMNYLNSNPTPGLILLDLNMPKMDGQEALRRIKGDPKLRQIPVIVLTTSQAEEDIFKTYSLGVNSFITKPVSFSRLVQVMKELGHYWLEIVELP